MIQIQSPYIDRDGIIYPGLERRYSDINKRILQIETSAVIDEAIDIIPCRYTYEETDEDIPESETTDDEYIQAAKIMLGEED